MPILLTFKHAYTIKFTAKMASEDHIVMNQCAPTPYTFTIKPKMMKYYLNVLIMENVLNQCVYAINIGQDKIVVFTREKNVRVSYYLIGQS